MNENNEAVVIPGPSAPLKTTVTKRGPRDVAFLLAGGSIGFVCLTYAIYNRSEADWKTYPLWITIAGTVAVWAWVTRRWQDVIKMYPRRPWLRFQMAIFAVPQMVALTVAFYYGIVVAIQDAGTFVAGQLASGPNATKAALITMITLASGVGLFWFRLSFRLLYGFSEALVGVLVAGHRITTSLSSVDLYLAILTAGVYLVVRGLDNMHIGWKNPLDPVSRRLVATLSRNRPTAIDGTHVT
ncbi:MAG: hypothetical protein JWR21_4372 [Herminiimonas sp.]|nr:hypothetical protein [Herminiimonas sp.]